MCWRIDRGDIMKRWKKCSILILYTVVLGVAAGVAGYQLSENRGQKTFDNLSREVESFRTPKGWDDLTPAQQKNAKYIFSEDTIDCLDYIKDFDNFEKYLNASQPYVTFHYGEIDGYTKEQLKYGPVEKEEAQGEKKNRDELVELAKEQIDINYTSIQTAKDKSAERWRITFYNNAYDEKEKCSHRERQRVYMCYDGTVTLVTQILGTDSPGFETGLGTEDD